MNILDAIKESKSKGWELSVKSIDGLPIRIQDFKINHSGDYFIHLNINTKRKYDNSSIIFVEPYLKYMKFDEVWEKLKVRIESAEKYNNLNDRENYSQTG